MTLRYTLSEIAELTGGKIIGDEQTAIEGINSIGEASPGDLSYFADPRYEKYIQETGATALLVSRENDLFKGPQILVPNPPLAFAKIAALFSEPDTTFSGISPQAFIQEGSRIGKDVTIYPFVYVGADVVIGDHSTLFPGVFVGDNVHIGSNSTLYPNVAVMKGSHIGRGVTIHAGSVIGSDGFGFVREGRLNVKVPQIGTVQIDDDVEIGANSTIDRAALGKTWIKRGVKTDNQVQVAHNVVIEEDTVIVAQTAIAGSAHIGKGVIMGGQVAIADHVKVGDGAMIGSQSGVPKSIGPGEVVSGTPSMPHRLWLKTRGMITRLPKFVERLGSLEKRVKILEKTLEIRDRGASSQTPKGNTED